VHIDRKVLSIALLAIYLPLVATKKEATYMKKYLVLFMVLSLLSCEKEDNLDKENDNWFKTFTSGNSLSKVIKDWDDSYVLAGNVNVYNTIRIICNEIG
jgi:hypothetical protein